MPKDEVYRKALGIIITGFAGTTLLVSSGVIDKFIQTSFPVFIPVSSHISVMLTSLAGGLLAAVAIYCIDKMRSEGKIANLQVEMMGQSSKKMVYKIAQTWLVLHDAIESTNKMDIQMHRELQCASAEIKESEAVAKNSRQELDKTMQRIRNFKQRRQ